MEVLWPFTHPPHGNILHNYIIISKSLVDPCNHHHNQDAELWYPQGSSCSIPTPFSSHPTPWQPLFLSIILLFQECSINGILQYVTLQDWLFFTQNNALNIHTVVACINKLSPPFFWWVLFHSMECTTICLTIHSLNNIWVVANLELL